MIPCKNHMLHSHSADSTSACERRICQPTAFLFTAQTASQPDTDTHSDTLHSIMRIAPSGMVHKLLLSTISGNFALESLLSHITHTAAFAPKASAKSYASPDDLFCCFLAFFFKALAAWGLNWPDALYSSAVWSAWPTIVSPSVFSCAIYGNRPIYNCCATQPGYPRALSKAADVVTDFEQQLE